MIKKVIFLKIFFVFKICTVRMVIGEPIIGDSNSFKILVDEVTTVKNTMKVLSDQWEKWHTLFITSFEPRITSTASMLSSIDSNIHNLQERAHVWDTFQLHVTAWNDQLASLDRKMAILSKGMEQVAVIENKLNKMQSAEYKLDTLIKMVNTMLGSLLNPKQSCKTPGNTLFEEFAVRGVLSSLKLLERKVDKLFTMKQQIATTTNKENAVKCNIPKATADILSDISSKVDVIFDSGYKSEENEVSEAYVEGSGGSFEFPDGLKKLKDVKRGLYLAPHTDYKKAIQNLDDKVSDVEANIVAVLDSRLNHIFKNDIEELLKHFKQSILEEQSANMNLMLESYFNEYRTYLSSDLNRFSLQCCMKSKSSNNDVTQTTLMTDVETSTTKMPETTYYPDLSVYTTTENDHYEVQTEPVFVEPIQSSNKTSCNDLTNDSPSGVYVFKNSNGDYKVERFFNKQYCLPRPDGLWTVIQRRDNFTARHNFSVAWNDYKVGFGDLNEDFWIGNNYLSRLSGEYNLTLRVELGDFDGNEAWAEYDTFKVDGEANRFRLTVGGYSGNASDALSSHSGAFFSTYDRKNDDAPECCPCSVSYGGGWWFTRCFESNLNGFYYQNPYENDYFRGVIWEHWLGNYSLKKSTMMIKFTGLIQSNTPKIFQIEDP